MVKHADIKTGNMENRQNGFCICVFYHRRSGGSSNAQTRLSWYFGLHPRYFKSTHHSTMSKTKYNNLKIYWEQANYLNICEFIRWYFSIITHALDAIILGECGQNAGKPHDQKKKNPRTTNVSKDFIQLIKVPPQGLEPWTRGLRVRCSSQLS